MTKRVLIALLVIGTVGLLGLLGCATVASTNSNTQVKLAASNVTISGTTMTFALTALNQDNNVISGLRSGNFSAVVYTSEADASNEVNAVATLAFNSVSGGSGSTKNIAVALVIDKSGSMDGAKEGSAEIAARLFVSQEAVASTSNKAACVLFSLSDNSVSVEAPMTQLLSSVEVGRLNTAINKRTGYGYDTALFDAIKAGVREASKEAASSTLTRAVIALTDGGENASTSHSTVEVVNYAIAAGIPVYTVGLFTSTAEAETANSYTGGTYRSDLQYIAKSTTGSIDNYFEIIVGSTAFSAQADVQTVKILGALTDLYQKLAIALTNSYTVSTTLSTSLSARTYYCKMKLVDYSSFTGQTLTFAFTAQ